MRERITETDIGAALRDAGLKLRVQAVLRRLPVIRTGLRQRGWSCVRGSRGAHQDCARIKIRLVEDRCTMA
jgi:hypothetical protein